MPERKEESTNNVQLLLSAFFGALTGISLTLCFFSLLSSMGTNIYEQTKEIGVLRAIGAKPNLLLRLYINEAFVLVMAAASSGFWIGTLTAYAFMLQRSLFTGLTQQFVIAYNIIVVVFVMAILCAMVSSCVPAWRLSRM